MDFTVGDLPCCVGTDKQQDTATDAEISVQFQDSARSIKFKLRNNTPPPGPGWLTQV